MLASIIATLIAAIAPAHVAERRCGWLANPTPANWWLTDRDGQWLIGEQGGYQAPGLNELPDMSSRGWVRVNGSYGYGCACMTVYTDKPSMRITRILSATPQPLCKCGKDPKLPQ